MAAPHLTIPPPETIAAAKACLRTEIRAASRTMEPDLPSADPFAPRLSEIARVLGIERIAAFWPMRGEPDLRPFMAAHTREGGVILLPRIVERTEPLRFDRWRPERPVRPGPLGTRIADALPDESDLPPELILVPLLAFDGACRRLGRGGGLYDRTLARHASIPAIGIAFALQERAHIPCEPHDRPLDAIVTECGIRHASHFRVEPP